jgi:5'-3' exonuclease
MILIDFSNLTHRMVFAAISNAERNGDLPKLSKGKKHNTQELKPFFLHLLFNNLKYVKEHFSLRDNEEIVCCLDSSSWRKDFYPKYKHKRADVRDQTSIIWSEFYEVINETVDIITKYFPFIVLKVDKAEGDDIMAVLAKKYHKEERILLITEDKDFRQLLEYNNVQLYRPILKQYVNLTPEELIKWRIEHILLGDKIDGIPTIKEDSEFTVDFINYLKTNNILEHTVYNFMKHSDANNIMEAYTGVDKYGVINIFKAPGFGEVSAKQFVATGLLKNLRKNKIWKEGFRRNRMLVQFKYIPKDIEDNILEQFEDVRATQNSVNSDKIVEFFKSNSLKQLANNVDAFCDITEYKISLDDWF